MGSVYSRVSSSSTSSPSSSSLTDSTSNKSSYNNNSNQPNKRRRLNNEDQEEEANSSEKEATETERETPGIRKTSMAAMRRTTNNNDAELAVTVLDSIQRDLEQIECDLRNRPRGILFEEDPPSSTGTGTGSSSSIYERRSREYNDDTSSGGGGISSGGRALFESIGTALGNIRGRLQTLTAGSTTTTSSYSTTGGRNSNRSSRRGQSNHFISSSSLTAASTFTSQPGSPPSHSPADATTGPTATAAATTIDMNTSIRNISQRLNVAEQSHSTRTPLNLLQTELSRRNSLLDTTTTTTTTDANAAAAATADAAAAAISSSLIGNSNNNNHPSMPPLTSFTSSYMSSTTNSSTDTRSATMMTTTTMSSSVSSSYVTSSRVVVGNSSSSTSSFSGTTATATASIPSTPRQSLTASTSASLSAVVPPPIPPRPRMQRRSSALLASRTSVTTIHDVAMSASTAGLLLPILDDGDGESATSTVVVRERPTLLSSSSMRSITCNRRPSSSVESAALSTLQERSSSSIMSDSVALSTSPAAITTTNVGAVAVPKDTTMRRGEVAAAAAAAADTAVTTSTTSLSRDHKEEDDNDEDTIAPSFELLYPESIRKQLTEEDSNNHANNNTYANLNNSSSMRRRGSLKLLSEDCLNRCNSRKIFREELEKKKNHQQQKDDDDDDKKDIIMVDGEEKINEKIDEIPPIEIYTWGSLQFAFTDTSSDADVDMDDNSTNQKNEVSVYQLFGSTGSSSAEATENNSIIVDPRILPSDTRLGRSKNVISMSCSERHCGFVVTSKFSSTVDDGRLLICGSNSHGQCDPSQKNVSYIPRPTSLEVLAMNRIQQVACGTDHTAVLTETKSVLTWGSNLHGQLGHRRAQKRSRSDDSKTTTNTSTNSFVLPKGFILGNSGRVWAADVACGDGYTLVLTTRMEVYMAGREEITGGGIGGGDDDNLFFSMPFQNSALQGLPLVGISAGKYHAVVWTESGTAYAWGSNNFGECGREFPRKLSVPVPIAVPKTSYKPFQSSTPIASNFFVNWNVWASSSSSQKNVPISLAKDVNIVEAACGQNHTILLTETGRLLVCGSNDDGQFPALSSPVSDNFTKVHVITHPKTEERRRFECVKAGARHTLLLDDSGCVYEMGNGMLSMSNIGPSLSSSHVTSSAPSLITAIETGGSLNFAIVKPQNNEKYSQHSCAMIPTMAGLDDLMETIRLEYEKEKRNSDSGISEDNNRNRRSLDSVEDLAARTEELFRSPAVMNSLFMDPKEIDAMYRTLIYESPNKDVKQRIATAIEKGILMGLKSISDARLMHFESVRFLLLYLQCPLWRDQKEENSDDEECKDDEEEKEATKTEKPQIKFDTRGDLLFLLCETILGLPFEGYKALLAWSATFYGEELFVPFLVKPLVYQLNYRFVHQITHGVPNLCGVLHWFHTINERSDLNLARLEDFHCSGIEMMPMEALYEDLVTYQCANDGQRSSNFFLVAHPFLLSISVKQDLLNVESQMSMVEAAQAGGVSFDPESREYKFKPYFVLAIDRKYLLPQTLQAVAKASTIELRKSLRIVFKGEDGVDAGGVTNEFFMLLCEKLFDVNTGMWTTISTNETWFNSDCTWNGEGYYLVGVLCGIAVYNSVVLDVHFPHALYRKLLGLPLGLEDLIDDDVRRGLKTLLDYEGDDTEDIFCLNFEVTWMVLGQEQKKELKPGGSDIAVTFENKEEYVMLYVKWLLVDSIGPQYSEFERGFMKVMVDSSLEILLAEELELLVAGTPELDFDALENSSEYEGGYDEDSPVVGSIWKWVQSASLSTQERFLKFCTGSSKAPIGGLGEMPFKIQRAGPDSIQLPTAHTCFNTLIVPDYGDDYDKLSDRLGRAVIECEGFGLQ